ncbi:MAG TPA: Fe-S protein assembly co-chaperone HscB [Ferruginibacter sp.]|nr:Fe-S protein assembly co-chaperone HscB [Ferruginibacter sp.]HMP21649.1 Fe-S protein assembly co-chaperone HscB [Ferruginibacter sp.]
MNYFELFEIPVSLITDKALLSKKYFELQKKYHPDFFTKDGEDDQAAALEMSSAVNKAYKILQQPEATLKYLLQFKGMLEEEEKYQLPPDFLMAVMELNENMDENASERVQQFENEIYAGVKSIIENYNDNRITEKELLQLKEYYFKKKYLQRILERMDG